MGVITLNDNRRASFAAWCDRQDAILEREKSSGKKMTINKRYILNKYGKRCDGCGAFSVCHVTIAGEANDP